MRIRRILSVASLFVLALGAGSGIFTATTSWASGVSVGSESQAIANEEYSYPLTFDASLQTALIELQNADPSTTAVATSFYSSYVSATQDYNTALVSAADLYAESYTVDPLGAKDVYIDNITSAHVSYISKLEFARNTLASELVGKNDQAKNIFVSKFNIACDGYSAQFESMKNEIASL